MCCVQRICLFIVSLKCFRYFQSLQVHCDFSDASEEEEEEEPEEVKGAWEELIIIQREQQRCAI